MILKYKDNLVFKISVLLLVIVLSLALMFCVTYGRFFTQTNRDISFSAKPLTHIYFGASQVSDSTPFQISQWTQTANLLSGNFTLSNTINTGDELPLDDVSFCVRVYIAEQDFEGGISGTPAEITLLTDQVTCFSKVETINQNTDFYNKMETNQCLKLLNYLHSLEEILDKTCSVVKIKNKLEKFLIYSPSELTKLCIFSNTFIIFTPNCFCFQCYYNTKLFHLLTISQYFYIFFKNFPETKCKIILKYLF
jgi:hypothetical protein